jgi:DNA-binding response OmpR family regulator
MVEVEGGGQSGATFRVLIPLSCQIDSYPPQQVQVDLPEPSSSSNATPQVLIVEDDDAIREYFEAELQEEGFRVITAINGQDGLSMYLRHRPSVVLTDIRMPVMDGLELLARIRASDSETPVILCTGYYPGLTNDLTGSLHRANCVLEKPVAIERVIEAIRASLASKGHIAAS